jgi:hypothetical protein
MRNGLRPLGLLGAWMMTASCADSGADAGETQTEAGLTWCDVEPILEAHCQRCHTDPPANGAPFPLLTYEDTQAGEPPRYERMGEVVSQDFMPPQWLAVDPPVEALPCSEKRTLIEWVEQAAPPPPAGDEACLTSVPTLVPCAE